MVGLSMASGFQQRARTSLRGTPSAGQLPTAPTEGMGVIAWFVWCYAFLDHLLPTTRARPVLESATSAGNTEETLVLSSEDSVTARTKTDSTLTFTIRVGITENWNLVDPPRSTSGCPKPSSIDLLQLERSSYSLVLIPVCVVHPMLFRHCRTTTITSMCAFVRRGEVLSS
jgi:hypothetical protein